MRLMYHHIACRACIVLFQVFNQTTFANWIGDKCVSINFDGWKLRTDSHRQSSCDSLVRVVLWDFIANKVRSTYMCADIRWLWLHRWNSPRICHMLCDCSVCSIWFVSPLLFSQPIYRKIIRVLLKVHKIIIQRRRSRYKIALSVPTRRVSSLSFLVMVVDGVLQFC